MLSKAAEVTLHGCRCQAVVGIEENYVLTRTMAETGIPRLSKTFIALLYKANVGVTRSNLGSIVVRAIVDYHQLKTRVCLG
jgi:hypothetical protein